LTRLPGIRVTYAGFNGDITLEEMFFEIDHGGRQLKIFVSEKEPLRFMAGANLEKALSELIEKESVAQSDH